MEPRIANHLASRLSAVPRTEPAVFVTRDVPTVVQAMKHGAVAFLVKPSGDEASLAAIRDARERSPVALPDRAAILVLEDRYASLTLREREVMELVVFGLPNKRIAGELGISEFTVKAHRGQVTRKMKADSV